MMTWPKAWRWRQRWFWSKSAYESRQKGSC